MSSFRARLVSFLRDAISFIIYIFLLFHARSGRVTLLYHSVGEADLRDDPYRLNIRPNDFDRHLKAVSGKKDGVEIHFDDGYGNNYVNAFPLLKKYNMNATIFIITDFIDGKISSEEFGGKGFKVRPLTWDEIRTMDRSGIRFGSHSKTHRLLAETPEGILAKELAESKSRIEENLGHGVEAFAYPFGGASSFNAPVREAVETAGYKYAYTNIMGSNAVGKADRFRLRRIRIYSDDGTFRLRMKMGGAYDWVDLINRGKHEDVTILKDYQRET